MSEPPAKRIKQAGTIGFADDATSSIELLLRQLDAVKSLLDVYTVEHHALLEELNARHQMHVQASLPVYKDTPQRSAPLTNTTAGEVARQGGHNHQSHPHERATFRMRHMLPQLRPVAAPQLLQLRPNPTTLSPHSPPRHAAPHNQAEDPQAEPAKAEPGAAAHQVATPTPPEQHIQKQQHEEEAREEQQQQQQPKPQPQQLQQQAHDGLQQGQATVPLTKASCTPRLVESEGSGAISLDHWVGPRANVSTPQSMNNQPPANTAAPGCGGIGEGGAGSHVGAGVVTPPHRLSVVREHASAEGTPCTMDAGQEGNPAQSQHKVGEEERAGAVECVSASEEHLQEWAPSAGVPKEHVQVEQLQAGYGPQIVAGAPKERVGEGARIDGGGGRLGRAVEEAQAAAGAGEGGQQGEVKVESGCEEAGGVEAVQVELKWEEGSEGHQRKREGGAIEIEQSQQEKEQRGQHSSQLEQPQQIEAQQQKQQCHAQQQQLQQQQQQQQAHTQQQQQHAFAEGMVKLEEHALGAANKAGHQEAVKEVKWEAQAHMPPPCGAAEGAAIDAGIRANDSSNAAAAAAAAAAATTAAAAGRDPAEADEAAGRAAALSVGVMPATTTGPVAAAAPPPPLTTTTTETAAPRATETTASRANRAFRNLLGQYGDEALGTGGMYQASDVFSFKEAQALILSQTAPGRCACSATGAESMAQGAYPTPAADTQAAPATHPTAATQSQPSDPVPSSPTNTQSAASHAQQARSTELHSGPRVASPEEMAAWRARFVESLPQIAQLEAAASAITEQELDAEGSLACLAGRTGRYLIKRTTVLLGRSTDVKGGVDVDLECKGSNKVSRRQAYLNLDADGTFKIVNAGRRVLLVDGVPVAQFESARMNHLSLLEVGDVQLLMMVNKAAVERVKRRTQRAAV